MNTPNKALLLTAITMLAWPSAKADNVAFHTPEGFQVLSVSPNGKWACGVYIDATLNSYPFLWDLESADVEMLSSEPGTAWGVANDGTVSGEFTDHSASSNGAGVEMPGYWRGGVWQAVEMPAGAQGGAIGSGISPDGHYMTGAVPIDGTYRAFIWKDGQIHRSLPSTGHAVGMAVSPDGSAATGYSTRYNRTACYWAPEGEVVFFDDSDYPESPWNYGRAFSPDGKKLLYWGGWKVDDDGTTYLYSVYDIEEGTRTRVPSPALDSDLEFFGMSNTGLLVGTDRQRGYVWTGESGMVVDDYLALRGVDLSNFDDFYGGTDYYQGQLPIFRVVSVNEDDTVLAMNYYNYRGQMSSMIVKVDVDLSKAAPAKVKAAQLTGLQTVGVTWKRPVGAASAIRGYNVYRNGQKINGFLPLTTTYFYDRNLQAGTYEYQVTSVNMAGQENRSETLTVTVETPQMAQEPLSVFSRQKGVDKGHLSWQKPLSNLVHRHYYDSTLENVLGFSVYEPVQVEMAIKYDQAELANYSGYKVSEVTFYPVAKHDDWTVRLYTHSSDGILNLLHEQAVTQPIEYKTLNTVKLTTPVDLPAGDLIVAIGVTGDLDSQETLGGSPDRVTIGYSDLLRQHSEPDFYSAFERSAAGGFSISCVSWLIDLGLEAPDYSETSSQLAQYNVYLDGEKIGATDTTSYVTDALATGQYTMGVEAVYADGSFSPMAEAQVNIKALYPAVEDIDIQVGETDVTATWDAAIDDDRTDISYVTAKTHYKGIQGVAENGYAMVVGAEYPASKLRGLDGYRVKSMRFYPLADALFTFMLYEDNQLVYELEVEDFTIGKWNEIEVPDDVVIKPNCTYFLAIDCFDPEPDVPLMAIDHSAPLAYQSDLYSLDNGETWSSLSIETSAPGNWMMGFVVEDPEGEPISVDGYDVAIDNKVCNSTPVTDTHYSFDLGANDSRRHSLRIDTHYTASGKVKVGTTNYFYLESGISDAAVTDIALSVGDNYLVAKGDDVLSITVIGTDGRTVSSAKGSMVEISHLTPGIYVVQMQSATGTAVRKINIK